MVEKLHPFTTELPELRHDKTFLPASLAGALPVRGPSAFFVCLLSDYPITDLFYSQFSIHILAKVQLQNTVADTLL